MQKKTDLYAAEAKRLVCTENQATLSTISVKENGFPFGSITPYCLDENDRILIYISKIAEHYRNLLADPRASLTIADSFGSHDPQAHARATLLLKFTAVQPPADEPAKAAYELRFPESKGYALAHDFLYMQGEIARIRWIGGFGEIGWIESDEFLSAPKDQLCDAAKGICNHMNSDHKDALMDYVKAFGETKLDQNAGSYSPRMIAICQDYFIISLTQNAKTERIRINFPERISDASQVRSVMIKLLQSARDKIVTTSF